MMIVRICIEQNSSKLDVILGYLSSSYPTLVFDLRYLQGFLIITRDYSEGDKENITTNNKDEQQRRHIGILRRQRKSI